MTGVGIVDGLPLDAWLMQVFSHSRGNAEDLVYVYLQAMEESNERVATLNNAAATYSSLYDEYGDDLNDAEYQDATAGLDLEWYFGNADGWRNDPPDWYKNGEVPTEEQATAFATQLTNAATAEQSVGSVLLTKLQSANNDLDEADRINTAYIEKVFQTNLTIINNF